jgi:hypothetical protein
LTRTTSYNINLCEVQSELLLAVQDLILLTKEQTRKRFDTSIQNSEALVRDDLGGSPWIQIPIESPASKLVARGMNRRRGARNYSDPRAGGRAALAKETMRPHKSMSMCSRWA